MSNLTFAFGGDTGETPESLRRKRELAQALLSGGGQAPQNIGEGLIALGDGIAGGLQLRSTNKAQKRGEESAANAFAPIQNALFGGQSPTVSPQPAVSNETGGNFIQKLFSRSEPKPVENINEGRQAIGELLDTGSSQLAQLTSRNETGTFDLEKGSFQIANDTSGTKSYGFLGVNSGSGSASQFAQENPSLGLTARAGTPEFDAQWRRAAQNNPKELVRAQLEYQEKHIHNPARQRLEEAGLGRFANDPRALSFVGDTVVQFGSEGARSSVNAGRNAQTVEEFINSASQSQLNNVDSRFRTYLSENPQNRQGIVNRLNRRREQALGLSPSQTEIQTPVTNPATNENRSSRVSNEQLFSVINNPFASKSQVNVAQTILNQRLAADAPLTRAQRETFSRQDRTFDAGRQDRSEDVNFRNQESRRNQFNTNRTFDAGRQDRDFDNDLSERRFELDEAANNRAENKAALEQQKIEQTSINKQNNTERNGNVVTQDIARARDIIENGGFFNGTGAASILTRRIPGTDGHRLGSLITTIKANAGFDKLQALRDASPTGGALGGVNRQELEGLQAAIGNLEQSQNDEDLSFNLQRVEDIYNNIIDGTPIPERNLPGQDLNAAQNRAIEAARLAIKRNAPREAVLKRLRENGISTDGL